MFPFVLIAISTLYTAAWLAQLVERQSVVREVKPLSVGPAWGSNQGFEPQTGPTLRALK